MIDWMWWIFRLGGLAIYIGMFVTAVTYLVPKAYASYVLWKTTSKPGHLSAAVTYAVVAFFFLSANFVIFIQAFIGRGIPCII